MVILKKIRAATLIETLTASVLIIIVFMIASLSFNNIFSNQIKKDHSAIENRIKELEYRIIHHQLQLPYTEDFGTWEIEITSNDNDITISYNHGDSTHKKQILLND